MARRGNGRRGILQPGHGSSGPRRIKGNFMEIGFIHNYIHLCVPRRAEQAAGRGNCAKGVAAAARASPLSSCYFASRLARVTAASHCSLLLAETRLLANSKEDFEKSFLLRHFTGRSFMLHVQHLLLGRGWQLLGIILKFE